MSKTLQKKRALLHRRKNRNKLNQLRNEMLLHWPLAGDEVFKAPTALVWEWLQQLKEVSRAI